MRRGFVINYSQRIKNFRIRAIAQILPHLGVIIKGNHYAMRFTKLRKAFLSVESLKDEFLVLLKSKKELDEKIESKMGDLMIFINRFSFSDEPHKNRFVALPNHDFANTTIKSLALFQKTQATNLAIKQELITSTRPDVVLFPHDKVLVIIPKEKILDLSVFLAASLNLNEKT